MMRQTLNNPDIIFCMFANYKETQLNRNFKHLSKDFFLKFSVEFYQCHG